MCGVKKEASKTQLRAANRTLRDITNENLKRRYELSKVKIGKFKDKNEHLETVPGLKLKIWTYSQRENHVILIPAFKLLMLSQIFKILLVIASIPLRLENSTTACWPIRFVYLRSQVLF